jgi:hypothetical protein
LHEQVLKHPEAIERYQKEITSLKSTLSWTLTWPLRAIKKLILFVFRQITRIPFYIGWLIHTLLVRPILAVMLWPFLHIAPLKRLAKGLVNRHPRLKRITMTVTGRPVIAPAPIPVPLTAPTTKGAPAQAPALDHLTPRARSIYNQLSELPKSPKKIELLDAVSSEKLGYSGKLQVISSPQRLKASEKIWIDISVLNASDTLWSATGKHPVRFAYRWVDQNENIAEMEAERTPVVGGAIKPNEQFRTHLLIQAPPEPGKWKLLPTLVHEGVCWFDQQPDFESQLMAVTVREPS